MASCRRGGSSRTYALCRSSDHTLCTSRQSGPLWGSAEFWQECLIYPAPIYNIIIDTIFKCRTSGLAGASGRSIRPKCAKSNVSKGPKGDTRAQSVDRLLFQPATTQSENDRYKSRPRYQEKNRPVPFVGPALSFLSLFHVVYSAPWRTTRDIRQ